MQHTEAAIETVPSAGTAAPKPIRKEVRLYAGALMVAIILGIVMVVALVLLLRARTRRSHLSRMFGIDAEREKGRLSGIDPWSEAARRIEVAPDDHDTVDIDPRDLGPDDIEPRSGKGGA